MRVRDHVLLLYTLTLFIACKALKPRGFFPEFNKNHSSTEDPELFADDEELELLIHIFRHGARSPLKFPVHPEYWKDTQPGELMQAGTRMHYLLGTEMRKRYIINNPFLPNNYTSTSLYVRSTDFNRTMMSALSFLQGLYPAGTGGNLPDGLATETAVPLINLSFPIPEDLGRGSLPDNIQVIPICSTQLQLDRGLGADQPDACPTIREWRESNHASQQGQIPLRNLNSTLRALEKATSLPANQLNNMKRGGELIDLLIANKFNGFPSIIPYDDPLWVNISVLYAMTESTDQWMTDEQVTLSATGIFREIRERLVARQNGSETQLRLALLSGHDVTLESMLHGLGFKSWDLSLIHI
eukprot:TRINITY_DN4646_c0_g1_i1.p1 TRINITY_DN4646_c0_g1~~TRINITY_DN4646_c0_g1_i1.p1  ORF type:complete len:356 (-),score=32.41 TRINITY_DN4646_c0_g1_i1:61-1128(-)